MRGKPVALSRRARSICAEGLQGGTISIMADKLWYAALKGQQAGPFGEAQFREMIARGEVTRDTLVWAAPMPGWSKAGEVAELFTAAPRPPGLPPSVPYTGQPASAAAPYAALPVSAPGDYPGGEPGAPLIFTGGTWALFGRSLLVVICQYLVIPSPWVTTAYYRWFIGKIAVPNGKQVSFAGQPGDIWYVFILLALLGYVGFIHDGLQLLVLPLSVLFYLLIMRWVFANLVWEGQSERLRFTGGYWGLLGWWLFIVLAMISLIGWAWVFTAMMRWTCRHVEGTDTRLSFVAGGWSVLWRIWVLGLVCIFIIPIPWIMAWYVRWFTSQFCLSRRA